MRFRTFDFRFGAFSWIIDEDERVPDRLAIPFQKFRNRAAGAHKPCVAACQVAELKWLQLQDKLLASRGGWPH
jgi:hypothetical protein